MTSLLLTSTVVLPFVASPLLRFLNMEPRSTYTLTSFCSRSLLKFAAVTSTAESLSTNIKIKPKLLVGGVTDVVAEDEAANVAVGVFFIIDDLKLFRDRVAVFVLDVDIKVLDSLSVVEIGFRLEDKGRGVDFELGLVKTPVVVVAENDEILAEIKTAADDIDEVLLLFVLGAILDVFICAELFFIVLLDNDMLVVITVPVNFNFSIDETDTSANDRDDEKGKNDDEIFDDVAFLDVLITEDKSVAFVGCFVSKVDSELIVEKFVRSKVLVCDCAEVKEKIPDEGTEVFIATVEYTRKHKLRVEVNNCVACGISLTDLCG